MNEFLKQLEKNQWDADYVGDYTISLRNGDFLRATAIDTFMLFWLDCLTTDKTEIKAYWPIPDYINQSVQHIQGLRKMFLYMQVKHRKKPEKAFFSYWGDPDFIKTMIDRFD